MFKYTCSVVLTLVNKLSKCWVCSHLKLIKIHQNFQFVVTSAEKGRKSKPEGVAACSGLCWPWEQITEAAPEAIKNLFSFINISKIYTEAQEAKQNVQSLY